MVGNPEPFEPLVRSHPDDSEPNLLDLPSRVREAPSDRGGYEMDLYLADLVAHLASSSCRTGNCWPGRRTWRVPKSFTSLWAPPIRALAPSAWTKRAGRRYPGGASSTV